MRGQFPRAIMERQAEDPEPLCAAALASPSESLLRRVLVSPLPLPTLLPVSVPRPCLRVCSRASLRVEFRLLAVLRTPAGSVDGGC
jgi:hypothetical protein